MRGLAAEGDRVALDAERAEHDAERQVERLEHRALLDVQLEVGGGVLELAAAPRSRGRGRRRARASASGSATPSRSASCRSSSWSGIEPAAALEPNRLRPKRAPSSSAQSTSRTVTGGSPSSAMRRSTSTPGEHVQAAVEPAAVRHRVHVPADQERALGRAARACPQVAGRVDLDLDRQRRELPAQPVARRGPGVRQGDALGAVLVAGELAQLAQLGDGAARLERHG